MKCVICKRTIRAKETRSYHWLGERKVYACSEHNGDPFSEWIDKQYQDKEQRDMTHTVSRSPSGDEIHQARSEQDRY